MVSAMFLFAAILHQYALAAAGTLPRIVAKEWIYLFLQQTNTFNPTQNIFFRTFWTLHGAPTSSLTLSDVSQAGCDSDDGAGIALCVADP